MSYFFEKKLNLSFENALDRVKAALLEEGFGVVSQINMQEKMRVALKKEMKPYIILGACSPEHAWEAVNKDPNIGVLLPCNVVVSEISTDLIQVSVVNPMVAMSSVGSPDFELMAKDVTEKLLGVVNRL